MHEGVKVAFCCTYPTTSKTKLMFLLRLPIFPFCEEVQSSEVVNKLKDSSVVFLRRRGLGIHSETTTYSNKLHGLPY